MTEQERKEYYDMTEQEAFVKRLEEIFKGEEIIFLDIEGNTVCGIVKRIYCENRHKNSRIIIDLGVNGKHILHNEKFYCLIQQLLVKRYGKYKEVNI